LPINTLSKQRRKRGVRRFNLSFQGEILPGHDPVIAKRNFARLFAISDRQRIEQFFSGKPVVLRRNLDSQLAASWQMRMRSLGLQADLVAQSEDTAAAEPVEKAARTTQGPTPAPPQKRRQLHGAPLTRGPNLYTLRPYQVGAAQRQRLARAAQLQQAGTVVAVAAAIALALLTAGLRMLPPPAAVPALVSAASHHGGELMLGTREFLLRHDRSGAEQDMLSLSQLGFTGRLRGLIWEGPQTLLLLGETEREGNLYRCQIAERQCRLLADESGPLQADAVAVIAASGQLIVADSGRSQLSLHSALGHRLASAERALPAAPVLRAQDGLLLVNSTEGPGISVLRYEAESFAQQLDEILLLPPTALEAGLGSVRDFAWSGEQWWATLQNPDTGAAGMFRFDTLWNFLGTVALPPPEEPGALVPWGTRMLVLDGERGQLLRFSAEGEPGIALASPYLQNMASARTEALTLRELLGKFATVLLALLSLAASLFTLWQRQRQRVFAADRQRSAPPLGSRASDIFWLPPRPQGPRRLPSLPARLGLRQNHLGVLGKQLILVDHRGVYHVGNGIHLQQHPLFLKAEDVIVYTGLGRRAFAADAWPLVQPTLTAAGKADTAAVVVTLLESGHPLALAAVGLLMVVLASGLLLLF
jgi:hypothetical protein